jgi:hypothetical protein
MLKLGAWLVLAGSMASFLVACGSDEGEDGGISSGAANGSGATGSGPNINLGGSGNGSNGSGDPNNDGGIVELTPEEITAIEESACAGWTTEGESLPAVLFMVNDVSGSMDQAAPGMDGRTKWSITQEALVDAVNSLPSSTAVGIVSYPNTGFETGTSQEPRDVDECVGTDELVSIALLGDDGSQQRNALLDHLENASTGGGTPTHDAYRYGLIYGMLPFATNLKRFMLIITDGQPTYAQNCVGTGNVDQNPPTPTDPIVDEIAAAAEMGIKTFVIGSPGSEEGHDTGIDYRPWLSQAAVIGGTAREGCNEDGPDNYCHLDMTETDDFSAALNEGLEQIAGQINSCAYAVASPPDGQQIDMNQVNMIVNFGDGSSELVLRDDNGDCSEGWQLDGNDQVVLCGATCERVQADNQSRVELLFGCASGDVPIVPR